MPAALHASLVRNPAGRVISAALALLWLAGAPSTARSLSDPAPDAAPEGAVSGLSRASVELYLEVSINGGNTHTIVSFVKQAAHLYVRPKDLESLGIDLAKLQAALRAPPLVAPLALDSIPGLRFKLDEPAQTIELAIPDALRTAFTLGRGINSARPTAATGSGLVVNYDVLAQTAATSPARPSVGVVGEQRLFGAFGVLTNTGVAATADAVGHYVRQATTYRYDDPGSLTLFQAGDVLSSSLSWTRPVRLGGIELSRDFALRPDLITFPTPQLGGSAALPSTVDLYVNSMHELTGSVPNGPFMLNAPGITGAGSATVIVRDPFGREVSTTLPIYIDTRLLAPGLSSYSLEAGFLRYDYGIKSFDYEGRPALSGTYRRGASAETTLELHAEATPELWNAGVGALLRLGTAGVLNASLSGSRDSRQDLPGDATTVAAPNGVQTAAPTTPATPANPAVPTTRLLAPTAGGGAQVGIGYQYLAPSFSVTASATRSIAHYTDLAAVAGTPAPRGLEQLAASLPLGAERTLGSSFVRVDDAIAGRSALGSLWYSAPAGRGVSAFVNASRDFEQRRSSGFTLGVSVDFGDRLTGFASGGIADARSTLSASIARSADYGGGWEWQAQASRNDSGLDTIARGGYLGRAGELTATAQSTAGHGNFALEDVGGLLFMDGVIETSRRIGDGFALVATDGVPDVPVMHDNRLLGATDATGHLLVPDLNAYADNNIAIDALSLPPTAKIPVQRLDVTPRAQAGVLAHFAIERYAAAAVVLVDAAGNFLPAGTLVHHRESGRDFTVGYDGIAFIEDLVAVNHLEARLRGRSCAAHFAFANSDRDSGTLAQLGRIACIGDQGLSL